MPLVAFFAASSLGCTGSIGGSDKNLDSDGDGIPDWAETGTDPDDRDPTSTTACEGEAGHVVARRLTRTEYNNTVRDLFEFDVGRPADEFPDDVSGANGLTVSDYFLEKNEQAVTALSGLAVDNGFISCDPANDPKACARTTFEPFMARAWRRPVTTEEVDGVVRYLDVVAQESGETDGFQQAIRLGIQHVLMSPNFLFRFERVDDPESTEPQPLDNYDLASRLSYFLYDSMPDAELFAAAEHGDLNDPDELEAQVDRMLADPKGAAFVDKLVTSWLWTDRVDLLNPNPELYPAFDDELRQSMKQELSLFVREFVEDDRDFKDMLDADFTYVNARLAQHYDLPNADDLSSEFTRVSLDDMPERGGLLTMGAVLAATSVPRNDPTAQLNETNIIVRGKFVLDQFLCFAMPLPPADLDIGAIQAEAQKDIPDTAPRKEREGVRQQMDPCKNCHTYMDPIGFSMEHFDVAGGWRTEDTLGTEVDSTGVLLGTGGDEVGEFDGARSLGTLLKKDPRLSTCVTKTVMKLAVGRELNEADVCQAKELAERSDDSGNGLRALISSIVRSSIFTHQPGEAP